jgi:hypothetical protein
VVPISPHVQDSVPAISLATLRQVLAECELAHPERGTRWHHAAMIVVLRRIQDAMADVAGWWVQSEYEPEKEYFVVQLDFGIWTCRCPDFQQRGGPCKHALAVQLLDACERRQAAGSNVLPFPIGRYRETDRFALTDKGLAAVMADEPEPAA